MQNNIAKVPLSESEKKEILKLVNQFGNQWSLIGNKIGRCKETVKKFYKSYLQFNTISPKSGRPITITNNIKKSVCALMLSYPTQSLEVVSNNFNISKSTTKNILNENKIKYYSRSAVVPLKPQHKNARINMSKLIVTYPPRSLPPIIFTNESTVCVNLNESGIWREWGHHQPESFYIKDQKPLSVIIWGGIGPRGLEHHY